MALIERPMSGSVRLRGAHLIEASHPSPDLRQEHVIPERRGDAEIARLWMTVMRGVMNSKAMEETPMPRR